MTREFVHVDRTACPWLIKKFIDAEAEFIFAPTEKIAEVVEKEGAIPFDTPGVKLGHRNGKCSFETIIEEYKIKDPVLHELAKIVHAADMQDMQGAVEGFGLSAIMTGARFNVKDDFEAVKKAIQRIPHSPSAFSCLWNWLRNSNSCNASINQRAYT